MVYYITNRGNSIDNTKLFPISLFYSQGYEEKYEFKCETM